MALNREMIGFSYPPSHPFLVTEESIRNFADAIGDPHPMYRDAVAAAAAGHASIVAPPTFPIVVTMSAMDESFHDPNLGMDYAHMVHSDQKFEYVRPIQVGDELVVVTVIEDIRALAGNDFATFRTEVSSGGELVCTAWSKLVVRGGAE